MNPQKLLIVALAACLVACSGEVQAPLEQESAQAEETAPVEQAQAEPDAGTPPSDAWRDSALIDHMHLHAEQFGKLNAALEAGDLEAAMTPAYWLSRHEALGGIPNELQMHLSKMRDAALSVENAIDLGTASAAAERIGVACRECHAEAGVDPQL